MKKIISAISAIVIGSAAIGAAPRDTARDAVSAASEQKSLVILGDSIASGYGRNGNVQYNYGEICADYLGWDVTNFAVPGYDTDDLKSQLSGFSNGENQTLSDADVVVISIGGNDIIHYISKDFIEFAAENNFLSEGYTADDVKNISKPTMEKMYEMVNLNDDGGMMDYLTNGGVQAQLTFSRRLSALTSNLTVSDEYNEGYIENSIIPAVNDIIGTVKERNPNARIIVQTIYQPLQIEYGFSTEHFSGNYSTFIGILRYRLEQIMKCFNDQVKSIDGIDVADVYYQLTSLDPSVSQSDRDPGYTWYFTDMLKENIKEMDFHPNQKGHLAIAAEILDVIGELHDDTGLLPRIFNSLEDKDSYPEIARATYERVAGDLGDLPPLPETDLGDVNGDGLVDSVDAALVLVYNANLTGDDEPTLDSDQIAVADVNSDGLVDSVDASLILMYNAYVADGGTMSCADYMSTLK